MRRTLFPSVIILVILFSWGECFAVSEAALPFLRLPAGARASGMGESFVAISDDASATHWNPAGLGLYPLNSTWIEYPLLQGVKLKSFALVENDLPEINYKKYDMWAISDSLLFRWEGENWISFMYHFPASGDSAVFSGKLTCMEGEGKILWIGTDQGVYRFDSKAKVWDTYTTANGLSSDYITALATGPYKIVWAGTVDGICRFDGTKWQGLLLDTQIEDKYIVDILVEGKDNIWVATRSDLVRYDGKNWEAFEKYRTKSGDTWENIAFEFLRTKDDTRLADAVKALKEYNKILSDSLAPDMDIKLPYSLAIESEITSLDKDEMGSLWVGTKWGIKRYANKRWKTFGYRAYQVKEGDAPQKIAAEFLKSKSEERIDKLAQKIRDYNRLESESLSPGRTIYVYSSILGSQILSIKNAGGRVFVGTEFGTITYDGEHWSRYYHADLEKDRTEIIREKSEEIWFGTENKIVLYAHARREITFMHANLLPELTSDLYYEYLSYVQHVEGWGVLGGNITFVSYGKTAQTTEQGPTPIGYFDSYEVAFTLSYGTSLGKDASVGMNAKLIHSHLSAGGYVSPTGVKESGGQGTAFALDLGVLYKTFSQNLTLGAAVTNLGPDISYSDAPQADPLPANFAGGLAYRIFNTPYNRLTGAAEMNWDLVGNEGTLNLGMEYWYGTYVSVRAGYFYDLEGTREAKTFGAGLQYGMFRFDFAYIPSSKDDVLNNTMRFSVTTSF